MTMTITMKKVLLAFFIGALCINASMAQPKTNKAENMPTSTAQSNSKAEKIDFGTLFALYPKPITVIGAEVNGKINWLIVGHTGIIAHDRILVSMNPAHYTTDGIKKAKKFSLNLVSEEMLPKADYVGSVSGAYADKSHVFEYTLGKNGTPIIKEAPVSIECNVDETFEMRGYQNFVCAIAHTYVSPSVLDKNGRVDYTKLKPVLFEFVNYSYLATGEVLGRPGLLNGESNMTYKLPMGDDAIVRLSRVEVYPEHLKEYLKYASEVGERSLRKEPGVLTMYAVQQKDNPNVITILETYANKEAYESHLKTAHFQKYKQGTQHMVKDLQLIDQKPLNPANQIKNFIQ